MAEVLYGVARILQRFSVFISSEDPFWTNRCFSYLWLIFCDLWSLASLFCTNSSATIFGEALISLPTHWRNTFHILPGWWYSLCYKMMFSQVQQQIYPRLKPGWPLLPFDLGQDLICVFMCRSGAGTARPSGPQRMFANWTHLLYLPRVHPANQKRVHLWSRLSLFRVNFETPNCAAECRPAKDGWP